MASRIPVELDADTGGLIEDDAAVCDGERVGDKLLEVVSAFVGGVGEADVTKALRDTPSRSIGR